MHKNLFAYADRQGVYEALQRDYKRDHRQIQVMDLVVFAAVAFLARHLSGWDYAAVVIGTVVLMTRLNTFIDNSNRNFFMHMIDWLDAKAQLR
ncbi:hypothetical protein [Sphingomonas alba]|uniref:Uncharacterized protein n=1 Tax=Sphingomonas alba TaxID=2908208 RepID=A0ABT0RIN0_9SPHN|nr:hypothetical protein [Sphingomonas alba]MCL6682481.1 hypothetical protein [Sphingomonas alba]